VGWWPTIAFLWQLWDGPVVRPFRVNGKVMRVPHPSPCFGKGWDL